MRFLRFLLFVPVALIVIVFAITNPQKAQLSLWPTDIILIIPAYLLVIVPFLAGLLSGAALMWMRGLPKRWQVFRLRRQASQLETALRRQGVEECESNTAATVMSHIPKEATIS